jgi:hypothetical protein
MRTTISKGTSMRASMEALVSCGQQTKGVTTNDQQGHPWQQRTEKLKWGGERGSRETPTRTRGRLSKIRATFRALFAWLVYNSSA